MTTTKSIEDYLLYHSVNSALVAIVFGNELGLTRAQLHEVGMAAMFHDIGMAEIDTKILNKRRQLTKQERRARRKKNSECNNSECCSGILSHDDVIPAKQAATSSPLRTLSETHDVIVTREVCCYENGSRYPCV